MHRKGFIGNRIIVKGGMALAFTLLFLGCIEEYDAGTEFFESVLVVEAVITDRQENQEIELSRTFRFENDEPSPETNALVYIVDSEQNQYNFSEVSSGTYLSDNVFGARADRQYTLVIETEDGTLYRSDTVQLHVGVGIADMYPVIDSNNEDQEGLSLRVDSFDETGGSRFYRFEYEETYKIVAPYWTRRDAVFQEGGRLGTVIFQPKTEEQEICYNTVMSNKFILATTNNLSEDRLDGFEFRFIERDNFIIAHRYSVLLRKFTISPEAYSYYQSINEFSSSESLFSEKQPGFVTGNITVENSTSQKVIGYFDVSSVAIQRIFFDHDEYFPEDIFPAFPADCSRFAPIVEQFINGIEQNVIKYYTNNNSNDPNEGPYVVVARPCGDCTALGDNEVPDFWVE